jgi:PBP1b-binding outer membrane lipoprotein LpoB
MSHHTATYTTILLLALVTGGCASSNATTGDSAAAGNITACTEPRPQICTREYRPVCATLADGSTKTYATGCTACSDPKVSGYRDLACE